MLVDCFQWVELRSISKLDLIAKMSLDGNHMSYGACYASRDARDMALISLLRVAHNLISSASIIQNLGRLIVLRDRQFPPEDVLALFTELDPPFLDAFKIATSFENLFKAELLAFGYVVHKIDKRANGGQFQALANAQEDGPVALTNVKLAEGRSWKRRGPFTIASLRNETLTLGRLIDKKAAYSRSLRLGSKLVTALNFVREQRNTVHFVVNDTGRYNKSVVDHYSCLKNSVLR